MATTCDLRPFRDYDEHNVINLFAYSGSLPVKKGTFVKIVPSTEGHEGWKATDELQFLGDVGANVTNTVSDRYGVNAKITDAVNTDEDNALGMLLYDVKETDENGEKLIYNPRKAAEMQAVVSGQAVPVLTKGIVLYSGNLTSGGANSVTAGAKIYADALYEGELSASATESTGSAAQIQVGTALGSVDDNGFILLKIDL